ncbi:GntR family transcriptional regulator [Naasia lichenicola]|uniref:GntR family transcriptional regulator n=1 Tax=Naasia lichenicola TaxID=2565933 RepID=A0A4S4FJA2_9MICO|nr:GntR family transcriptional regulator [Naasia lichenicola]THG29932.1 GntR family transcriptional regulator [Naasia lichenicola]
MTDIATDSAPSTGASALPDLTRAIRDAIVGGEFAPNQRLIEADLSASFGASRASVRTALFELANDGLIDRLPNRGSRVRAISVDEAIEILEVRIGVEGLCAAKAAELITDPEIAEFSELRAALIASVEDGDLVEYSRLNQLLDRRVREISAHSTAVGIIERLRNQSVRHQFRLSFQSGRASVSGPEHVAIIDAIVRRDPEAAQAATRAHLQSVIAALRLS